MSHEAMSAMDCSYLDAQRIFMSCSDTGEYLERKDVAIASCGLPVEQLNFGFPKPPFDDLRATADAVRTYFGSRELPFQLTFRAGDRRRAAEALESSGWHGRHDPTPGMALAIPGAIPAPPARLAIETVRTPEQLVAFREVAFRGFGHPVAAAHIFFNEHLLAVPQVRLYAGAVDGTVVATSVMVATAGVAGVYWVVTSEEQRGNGYGAAITWAAVGGGREFGCRMASLQASKIGRPVYARMGFEHVIDYEYLYPPTP